MQLFLQHVTALRSEVDARMSCTTTVLLSVPLGRVTRWMLCKHSISAAQHRVPGLRRSRICSCCASKATCAAAAQNLRREGEGVPSARVPQRPPPVKRAWCARGPPPDCLRHLIRDVNLQPSGADSRDAAIECPQLLDTSSRIVTTVQEQECMAVTRGRRADAERCSRNATAGNPSHMSTLERSGRRRRVPPC